MDTSSRSRRSFLLSTGGTLSGVWLAAHWPAVAAAAHHADEAGADATHLSALSAAELAQVDAIASEIIPSGKTPGAHEAHAAHFVDHALGTFFAAMAPEFHASLTRFNQSFEAKYPGRGGFAAASREERIAFLKGAQSTPFFQTMRFLTVLGFLASPKYGGNAGGLGWKAIGFEDQHIFTPPFGYYDRDYAGFVPYGTEKRS